VEPVCQIWRYFFFCGVLVIFSAQICLTGSVNSNSGWPEQNRDTRMGAPLAEMMFYEAAEEAVEDSYARIVSGDAVGSENTEQNNKVKKQTNFKTVDIPKPARP
jgi:hypothetical protein